MGRLIGCICSTTTVHHTVPVGLVLQFNIYITKKITAFVSLCPTLLYMFAHGLYTAAMPLEGDQLQYSLDVDQETPFLWGGGGGAMLKYLTLFKYLEL